MARIELEVSIKVKIVVEDTAAWAVDYGLADDSPAAIEADVRDYFGGGGLAAEVENVLRAAGYDVELASSDPGFYGHSIYSVSKES